MVTFMTSMIYLLRELLKVQAKGWGGSRGMEMRDRCKINYELNSRRKMSIQGQLQTFEYGIQGEQ